MNDGGYSYWRLVILTVFLCAIYVPAALSFAYKSIVRPPLSVIILGSGMLLLVVALEVRTARKPFRIHPTDSAADILDKGKQE